MTRSFSGLCFRMGLGHLIQVTVQEGGRTISYALLCLLKCDVQRARNDGQTNLSSFRPALLPAPTILVALGELGRIGVNKIVATSPIWEGVLERRRTDEMGVGAP